jgi:hypothetical protein
MQFALKCSEFRSKRPTQNTIDPACVDLSLSLSLSLSKIPRPNSNIVPHLNGAGGFRVSRLRFQ